MEPTIRQGAPVGSADRSPLPAAAAHPAGAIRPAPTGRPGLTFAAAAVTVVLWASAFVVIRGASTSFAPGSMALLRMAVGTLALGAIALAVRARPPRVRELPAIAAWGVGWFAAYNLALNSAEAVIDAGTAAMLVNLAPLLVVVLAGVILHEGFPRALVIGVPVSLVGVALIASGSWTGRAPASGVAFALLAAGIYGVAAVAQKRLLRTIDAATLNAVGALAATLALLPWSGGLVRDLSAAPVGATLSVVYLGLVPTGIAFTTWAYVLARSTAGRTAATTYVVPVVALGLSWAVLQEGPTPLMLVGGLLCLVGVAVTRRPASRRASRAPRASHRLVPT